MLYVYHIKHRKWSWKNDKRVGKWKIKEIYNYKRNRVEDWTRMVDRAMMNASAQDQENCKIRLLVICRN